MPEPVAQKKADINQLLKQVEAMTEPSAEEKARFICMLNALEEKFAQEQQERTMTLELLDKQYTI